MTTANYVEFDAKTGNLKAQSMKLRPLADGEILVRIKCCTICGSDLHSFHGRRACPSPCVLGHEIVGTVAAWGGSTPPTDYFGVSLFSGQRITWSMLSHCANCYFCKHGLPQKCSQLFKYGHGRTIPGEVSGGPSDFCIIRKNTRVFPVPDGLADEVAAPANCATATVAAAIRLANEVIPINSSSVVVSGIGMLGLSCCAMLKARGCSNVIAIDRNHRRLALARRFGADQCVDAELNRMDQLVNSYTDEIGADIAFEFAGVAESVSNCLSVLRMGGLAILAGTVFPTDSIVVAPEDLVRQMLTIRGLHNYRPDDLESALNFLDENQDVYPFGELVTESFQLDQAREAIDFASQPDVIRVAIKP